MEQTSPEFFENSSRNSSQKNSRLHLLIDVFSFDLCFMLSQLLFNFLILRFYLPITIQYLIKLKNMYVLKYLCFYVDFLSSMDFSANSANFTLPWLTTLSIFSSFSRNIGKITVLENKMQITLFSKSRSMTQFQN
jgi:hypothetical protein